MAKKMAKYQGRSVKLNKPFRTSGERKKFGVYVKDKSTGNARHGAILKKVRGQKTLAPVYWAIKSWRKGFNV